MRASIMATHAMIRRQAISRKVLGNLLMVAAWLVLGIASVHAGTVTKVTLVMTDAQGNVLMTTDVHGNITARYTYRPYGTQQSGPTNKGPGYTGHVNDPDTGLVYMQQRYYDPATGQFISPDPVAPTPGNIFNFGRYTYANNNPLRFTDPDGRKVVYAKNVPDDFKKNFAKAIKYLNSVGGAANFAKLQKSKQIFVIMPATDRTNVYETGYSPDKNTIVWADKGGALVKDKSGKVMPISPAVAAGHEAEHALHDLQGTLDKDSSTSDAQFGTAEERKVITGYEHKTAKKLGEPIRVDHDAHGKITCPAVTDC